MQAHQKAKLDTTYNNIILLTQKKFRAYKLSREVCLEDRILLLEISRQGVFGTFYTFGSQNTYVESNARSIDFSSLESLQRDMYELLDDDAAIIKFQDLTKQYLERFCMMFLEIIQTQEEPIGIIALSGELLLHDLCDFFIKLEVKIQELSPLTSQTRLLNKSREFNSDLLQNTQEITTAPVGIGINIKERIYIYEMIDIEHHTIEIIRYGALIKEGECFSLLEAIGRDIDLVKQDFNLYTQTLAYEEHKLEIVLMQGETEKTKTLCFTNKVPYFSKEMADKGIDVRVHFLDQEQLEFELVCIETQETMASAIINYGS